MFKMSSNCSVFQTVDLLIFYISMFFCGVNCSYFLTRPASTTWLFSDSSHVLQNIFETVSKHVF